MRFADKARTENMTKRWIGPLILVPFLGACATIPTGPSVMVLPGGGKSFEQFQTDDVVCRQWAYQQTGTTPGQAASESGIASAVVGTVLGAAAGAAIGAAAGNPAMGAAAGAGTGLLFGSAAGVSGAQYSGYQAQQRYDIAFQQCMYAKGNQIPGVARGAYRSGAPAVPPPPPPPPPPPASSSMPREMMPPPPPPPR
jgi:hypothetical protein